MDWLPFAVIGYVCGSVPFGLLLAQAAGLGDVRKIGSGNIGATNVLRTGNKSIAALTLICDLGKGLVPVLLAQYFADTTAGFAAGFGALFGHIFPVWLKFKGGKGVATGLGVLFGWSWPVALVGLVAWIAVFAVSRISSLSALSAAVVAIVAAVATERGSGNTLVIVWPVVALAVIVFITHRANIGRLMRGEEPKSSFKKT